jgi:hypothetical protein
MPVCPYARARPLRRNTDAGEVLLEGREVDGEDAIHVAEVDRAPEADVLELDGAGKVSP